MEKTEQNTNTTGENNDELMQRIMSIMSKAPGRENEMRYKLKVKASNRAANRRARRARKLNRLRMG